MRPANAPYAVGPAGSAREGFCVPAAVSYAILLLLLGAGLWLALRRPPRASAEEGPRREVAVTIVRDVLTGRYTDEDGVPLAPESGWGSSEKPLRLRFVPSADQAQSGPTILRMLSFLRRRTGYHIEGETLLDYGLVVEEISQGLCEVAFLTAASYARAHYRTAFNDDPEDDLEAFLQVVRRGQAAFPGSDLAYRAALIVRVDSPIRKISDIKDETVVALGPRTSGASSILPSALFNRMGIHPTVQRYKGYPVIVNSVLEGATEVGSVWWSPPNEELPNNDARVTLLQSNPDVFERTRIIGYTAWIPNEPVVIREVVPVEIRHALARALTLYVTLRTLTEEGRQELVSVGSLAGFIPASDEDFQSLLEVIEQAFANDPEGRADFMAGS